MRILQRNDSNLLLLKLELFDEGDVLRASFQGTYRNGYPLETKDSEYGGSGWANLPWKVLQYLLHGNFIIRYLPSYLLPVTESPLEKFLVAAAPLPGLPYRESNNATKVALEVRKETHYTPVQAVNLDAAFDHIRVDRCKSLLKQEAPGAPSDGSWYLFVGDPTGRKKVRYHYGNFLCDADTIWSLEYGVQPGKIIITKLSAAGDLEYRVIFDEPALIVGFNGHIAKPTLREKAGYILFEWWDTSQPGYIKRLMEVSISIPKTSSR